MKDLETELSNPIIDRVLSYIIDFKEKLSCAGGGSIP